MRKTDQHFQRYSLWRVTRGRKEKESSLNVEVEHSNRDGRKSQNNEVEQHMKG